MPPRAAARALPIPARCGWTISPRPNCVICWPAAPSGVSIWDLPNTIHELAAAGFSTKRHQVWLQTELARPLFLLAMVLVAAAFTMRHTRFGGTGVAVLVAVLLGFALYFVRNFAQVLGENGQLPILLAAWAPPVASVMLGVGLLLQTEDG